MIQKLAYVPFIVGGAVAVWSLVCSARYAWAMSRILHVREQECD